MGFLSLFAAAKRGQNTNIYADQRMTSAGPEPVDEQDDSPNAKRRSPLMRAVIIFFLNILLGVMAGLIYRELELPSELEERATRAGVIARLNSTLNASDWRELVEVLGGSVEALQEEVVAVEQGRLHELDQNWDRTGGMFFAFTIATSIGYGTFTPVTRGGRFFTIIYALVSIPLMLSAFTNLCTLVLRMMADKFAGRKRDLPVKVFRMMDRDGTGTLSKKELIAALHLMGLGDYSTKGATFEKRRRFESVFAQVDKNNSGELDSAEFRILLQRLVPDEDQVRAHGCMGWGLGCGLWGPGCHTSMHALLLQVLILVDVITRSYVAFVSILLFIFFCLASAGAFIYFKRDDGWTFLDSIYFTTVRGAWIRLG